MSDKARIISLGGYTSILSNNGMAVAAPDNVKIITGNTLTAASGLKRVLTELRLNKNFQKKNARKRVGKKGNGTPVSCQAFFFRSLDPVLYPIDPQK